MTSSENKDAFASDATCVFFLVRFLGAVKCVIIFLPPLQSLKNQPNGGNSQYVVLEVHSQRKTIKSLIQPMFRRNSQVKYVFALAMPFLDTKRLCFIQASNFRRVFIISKHIFWIGRVRLLIFSPCQQLWAAKH